MNAIANGVRGCLAIMLALAAVSGASEDLPEVKHPWYDGRLEGSELKKAKAFVAPLMSLSDEQITALIPARKPFQGRKVAMPEDEVRWTPLQPKHVTVGKESFIPEERWPPTEKQTVTGPDGKEWTYEYLKGKLDEPFYPGCLRDQAARNWFVDAALHLARIYHTTGDQACGRKAAVIIARFAQVYPAYPITGYRNSGSPNQFFVKEPYPATSGKWYCRPVNYASDGSALQPLALAYDLIHPSRAIEELSRQWNRDLRQEIEEGFFLDYCRLMAKYDQWHAAHAAVRLSNLQPYKCRMMIVIGRTIGNPGIVHYAYEYLRALIDATFMVDGIFPESPDYHRQVVGSSKLALNFLEGYSDPPGYAYSRSGRRFDRYDPQTDLPILVRAKQFLIEASHPDGRLMTVHDTWPASHGGPKRTETTSRIWPAFGHAILGRGNGDGQVEVHLHFSAAYSHAHQDTLNLAIWALGEELLSDIGYTYTYRGWATSSLGHNLVVVDGKSQRPSPGQITAWSPVQKGCGVVQVQDAGSYPACSTYSRTLMLVEHDQSAVFCVDIFPVVGGRQHDWLAHGSADKDQTLQFDKPDTLFADSLAADGKIHIPGLRHEELVSKGGGCYDDPENTSPFWGNIRHVKKVEGPGPWRATFAGLKEEDARLRLHLLSPTDCQLYFGEAPSIRRADETDSAVEKYMMPILTARRELKAAKTAPGRVAPRAGVPNKAQQLTSRYVAVWEPLRGQPWIEKAEVLHDSRNGLVVSVQAGSVKYTILWTPDEKSTLSAPGGIQFTSRFACVRQEGQQRKVAMIGSGYLRGFGDEVRLTPIKPLKLLDTATEKDQDYLIVQAVGSIQLPEPAWGLLLHPDGYRRAVRLGPCTSEAGKLKIHCPDGLGLSRVQGKQAWKETCFPARTFQGEMRLEIIQRVDSGT